MKTVVKRIKEGISEVLFPSVCVICGTKTSASEHLVCNVCLQKKFDPANPEGKKVSSNTLLPEGIYLQHALWQFDKGGHLQDLLHQLKYNRLTGIGTDIGRQLGKSLMQNPWYMPAVESKPVRLVPVPLHPKKKRRRGYNQAYHIALGVAEVIGLHIIEDGVIQRIKNTRTQTGFSLEKRRQNIAKAFRVNREKPIAGKVCIIVDDVFTTGATTFELASVLQQGKAETIMIATVAQA